MAEQERLTNKERRAKAREERKRKEAEAAQRRRRNAIRNGVVAAVVFGVVTAVVLQAVLGGGETSLDDTILVSSDAVDEAAAAAGCETLVEREPLEEAGHFARNEAPPADLIYPDIRPTHSGPHTAEVVQPIAGGSSQQIDEYVSTHNLEHGAIIVWYDPDQVDEDTVDDMGTWARTLNENGFQLQGGALIYVSPYEDPGISSGKAIAMRAWGTAVDCDEWDETAANGFVARHFGTRGIGPEAPGLSPYPDDVLDITDEEISEDEIDDEAETDETHDDGDGDAVEDEADEADEN